VYQNDDFMPFIPVFQELVLKKFSIIF